MITRRSVLLLALAGGARASLRAASDVSQSSARSINSVTGEIPPDRLGLTLMHEHVLVDFVGAEHVSPSRYDRDEVFRTVLPHLKHARALGCETLVECTPAYLGRDPVLLKRLSEASGLHILTNTGYYGAAKDKHVPAFAFTETAEELAARWTREAERGIDGTSIRPAFMKIGVDEAPLSEIDTKLVRAAAITHLRTGLPIASHTSTGTAALEQLDLLARASVPLSSFIWVHAQNERDASFHTRAATRGAWIEFDGISPSSIAQHVELVVGMRKNGLLDRVLVSHDAGWYRVGEPGGGQFRPYSSLFESFVPALKAAGVGDDDIRTLLVHESSTRPQPNRAACRTVRSWP